MTLTVPWLALHPCGSPVVRYLIGVLAGSVVPMTLPVPGLQP